MHFLFFCLIQLTWCTSRWFDQTHCNIPAAILRLCESIDFSKSFVENQRQHPAKKLTKNHKTSSEWRLFIFNNSSILKY